MPGGVPGGRPARVRARNCFWVVILEPSGRFWWPFGTRLGAAGVARTALFGPVSGQNATDGGPGGRPGPSREKDGIWTPDGPAPRPLRKHIASYFLQNTKFRRVRIFLVFWSPKDMKNR